MNSIQDDFPFEPHYATVDGHQLHYIEQGEGDPILFLHGIPTWSYLWRNIIPDVSRYGRCIAVDLIGMGKSDKPDIKYTVFDHIRYINHFIEALNLKNITLVMHGWGSVIGLDYAMQHQDNIKALAFSEAHIRPATEPDMVALPVQQWAALLKKECGGFDAVMNGNYFVNKLLPWGVLRKLTDKEMQHYRMPFEEPGSCLPLWQYFEDLPLGNGEPKPVVDLITRYSNALEETLIPKLMLYAVPGFVTPISTVQWAKEHLRALTLHDIGDALHYAQESKPDKFGEELINWYTRL